MLTFNEWLRHYYGNDTILVREKPQPEDQEAYAEYTRTGNLA